MPKRCRTPQVTGRAKRNRDRSYRRQRRLLDDVTLTEQQQQQQDDVSNVPGQQRHQDDVTAQCQQQDGETEQQQHSHQYSIGRCFPPAIDTFRLGLMNKNCRFCGALRFIKENSNCCQNGKVSLPPLPQYSRQLETLFTSNHPQSRKFMENIRQYNSSVSFASFGGMVASPPGRGPYTFRLHGQLYHRAGCLHPPDGAQPVYSQLYILEADQAIQNRLAQPTNENCREDIMTLLTTTLNNMNPYAAAYRHMQEVERQQLR